jgi:hypothetical protein
MKTVMKNLKPLFTSVIPDELDQDKLYISIDYNTAVHLCACGCGEEVVTPLQPSEWKLIYNGETVTLHPSIGNWSYKCRSHYWIRENQILWAEDWSDKKIKWARQLEAQKKKVMQQKHISNKEHKPKTIWEIIRDLFK